MTTACPQSAVHAPGLVDITSGNNTTAFTDANGNLVTVQGYSARNGYDLATGVCTINAALFVPELAGKLRLGATFYQFLRPISGIPGAEMTETDIKTSRLRGGRGGVGIWRGWRRRCCRRTSGGRWRTGARRRIPAVLSS